MIQSKVSKIQMSFLWILLCHSLGKVMSSRFSVVYIGDQAYPALVQFICPFMMPGFPFHWHSKVLAFSVLRHKPIISFVCKIDCITGFSNDWKVFMRLHVFIAIDTDIVHFPLTILAFLVLRHQQVNLSCLSTLWSRRLSKRLKRFQAFINS